MQFALWFLSMAHPHFLQKRTFIRGSKKLKAKSRLAFDLETSKERYS
jgi:hypothetical protein